MSDQAHVEVYQWACPIKGCSWVFWSSDETDVRAAFIGDPETAEFAFGRRGGEIYAHAGEHRLFEWVQEVMDLRKEIAELRAGAGAEADADAGVDVVRLRLPEWFERVPTRPGSIRVRIDERKVP